MIISVASGKGGTGKTTVLMEIPFDRKIAEKVGWWDEDYDGSKTMKGSLVARKKVSD